MNRNIETGCQYLESYLVELTKKNSKLFNKIIACTTDVHHKYYLIFHFIKMSCWFLVHL